MEEYAEGEVTAQRLSVRLATMHFWTRCGDYATDRGLTSNRTKSCAKGRNNRPPSLDFCEELTACVIKSSFDDTG